jgi:hypothetical protein
MARLERTHPDYTANVDSWEVLLDAFEGTGGFLDGSYLWPYQREDNTQFERRRAMARYHNYLEALIDLYVRFIFTQGVKRTSKNKDFTEWLKDVDGGKTPINEFLRRWASVSLAAGHAGALVDMTTDEPEGPTKADERARVYATIFTAPKILDWRFKENTLIAVKLCEAAPEPDIAAEEEIGGKQYLIWANDGWARFNEKGELVSSAELDINLVPLVVMRPKPSLINQMIGRPIVSNANVIRAMFNRASEEDEVIRAQAFSLLAVEVDKDANVDDTKAQIGSIIGTAKALVVKGRIDYKTPDQSVPGTIRQSIEYLTREMYRAAHIRYNRDSLAAESAQAIRLQYSELNEMLQGFSKSLAEAELELARAWFAWQTPGDHVAAEKAFLDAEITAVYPDEFFLDDLITDLQGWAEAIALNLGPTMARRIKKKAVRRLDPDMPQDQLEIVDKDIDAMSDDELMNLPEMTEFGPDTGNPAQQESIAARVDRGAPRAKPRPDQRTD